MLASHFHDGNIHAAKTRSGGAGVGSTIPPLQRSVISLILTTLITLNNKFINVLANMMGYAGIFQTNDVAIVTNMFALNIRLTVQAVVIKFANGMFFAKRWLK